MIESLSKLSRRVNTMGIEDKIFVVDTSTGELSGKFWHQNLLNENDNDNRIAQEPFEAMLKIRSSVHTDSIILQEEMRQNRRCVAERLRHGRQAILACGAHPWADWRTLPRQEKLKHHTLLKDYGLPMARSLTCGLHVHFGFGSESDLVGAYNYIRPYLPFIAAVGAYSPFWCGYFTHLQSYRRAVYDALPRSGLPPTFSSFGDYQQFFHNISSTRCKGDATTVWWDACINTKHDTLEIQIADTIPDIRTAQAVVVFTHICVELALSSGRLSMDDAYIQENRWSATRFGCESSMFFDANHVRLPLSHCIDHILGSALAENIAKLDGWSVEGLRLALLANSFDALMDLGPEPHPDRFLGSMLRITQESLH